jgi:DNA helicase-2/ATP-dependent DNA helicase PcrA
MDVLANLNSRQREAVTHGEGPLLIVAGVGTGKTTVITRRIAWLIAEKMAKPAEILALTFTEKAAVEMEERVDLLVPYGYIEAHIGTFHAFCERILRENAILLGLTPDYRILTEAEQAIFLKDRLFELPLERFRPLGNPMRHLRAMLALFSRAKDENVTPEEYRAYTERLSNVVPTGDQPAPRHADRVSEQRELAATFAAYQRLLLEHGYVDFGDLITLVLKLLRDRPDVLARYQQRFRFILVDEFQDTNYAQFELLKLLARHHNLTVCGDDDQSIYKFRGAAISNILGFQQAYPDAKLVVLEQNYRSTQAILDASYRLIQHNNPDRLEVQSGITKRLKSSSGPGRSLNQLHFETVDEECDFVAETIAQRAREERRAFADFAVLVRSNAQATPFLHSMNLLQIPWHFSGSRGLYDQEEVRTAIAFLRTLADPRDDLSLHYLAGGPLYRVPGEDLALSTRFARRRNKSLLQTFRILEKRPGRSALGVSAEGRARMTKLLGDVSTLLPLSTTERTGEILYRFLSTQTGMIERLSNSDEPRDAQRVQNLAKLFSIIERFSHVSRYDRVSWFVDYIDALIEAGDNPPVGDATWDADAVNVLTIHQAKGLEYAIVFLVGLVSGRFPSVHRRESIPLPDELVKDIVPGADVHQQEERRLFYVGMTRAKEDVYLTSAQDYGGKRPRKPSLFVSEALDLDASQLVPQRRSPLTAILRHAKPKDESDASQRAKGDGPQPSLFPTGDALLTLSHRRIDDYLTCPLKYRYIHVLRVPIRQHHTVIYGNAIHQAVRLFNLNRHAGRDTPLDELREAFTNHWRAEGFLTRHHEELRLEEGIAALEAFHAYETAETSVPTYVERRFSVIEDDVRLIGVFDRIDLTGGEGTIIDYKTSDVHSREEADRRARDSRQLALYAFAYAHLFDAPPQGLELRFLTPEVIVGRASSSGKTLQRARRDIEAAATGIRAGAFPGEPTYRACRYCPYASICPAKRLDG